MRLQPGHPSGANPAEHKCRIQDKSGGAAGPPPTHPVRLAQLGAPLRVPLAIRMGTESEVVAFSIPWVRGLLRIRWLRCSLGAARGVPQTTPNVRTPTRPPPNSIHQRCALPSTGPGGAPSPPRHQAELGLRGMSRSLCSLTWIIGSSASIAPLDYGTVGDGRLEDACPSSANSRQPHSEDYAGRCAP